MPLTHRPFARSAALGSALVLAWSAIVLAQDPDASRSAAPGWILEDIEAGYAQAAATGSPLLVVFR